MSAKNQPQSNRENAISFIKDLSAGGVSGIVAKTITAPIERVKLLMQTQGSNRDLQIRYKGPIDCLTRVYEEQGFFAFWRGNMAGVMRYFPAHSITFAFKDRYKIFFTGLYNKPEFYQVFMCNLAAGGLAGGTALMASYPLDVIRTRLAADIGVSAKSVRPEGSLAGIISSRRYAGTWDCFKQTWYEGGIVSLYKGLPVALAGVVLFKALFLGGYDTSKSLLDLDSANSSLFLRFMTAQVITSIAGTLCYPIDTIKRRLMMQKSKGPVLAANQGNVGSIQAVTFYRSGTHCLMTVIREEGVGGLYHGLSANLMRGIGGAVLLVGYDEAKAFLSTDKYT
mmetsp:Transcript_9104/g.8979  ORF Transcript_9104/g.8979 Transcript_9104/m.8979 type:complete len:338 (+) Transcript_9104:327-1340(+)